MEGVRVLIVDDQKAVAATLAEMVKQCQHEVVRVVGSGLEAIRAYELWKPDAVLMDYSMAQLNGATACRNIRARHPEARIIIVTAWNPTPAFELNEAGAIAVLSKPVDFDALYAALHSAATPEETVAAGVLSDHAAR